MMNAFILLFWSRLQLYSYIDKLLVIPKRIRQKSIDMPIYFAGCLGGE
jgi:hypothetical protein